MKDPFGLKAEKAEAELEFRKQQKILDQNLLDDAKKTIEAKDQQIASLEHVIERRTQEAAENYRLYESAESVGVEKTLEIARLRIELKAAQIQLKAWTDAAAEVEDELTGRRNDER